MENSSSRVSQDGEVIIVPRISPGKSTIAKREIAINQDLKIVKSTENISSLFTYYLFNFLERHIVDRSSGTTVPGIRLKELENIQINLPPLSEQNRIIAKIEELFSELDNKPESESPQTKEIWYYDFRTNVHFTLRKNPLKYGDLQDFVNCYNSKYRSKHPSAWSSEKLDGRWRKFTYDELVARDKTSLDICWLRDESLYDLDNPPEPMC